jgi:hypothetical protein
MLKRHFSSYINANQLNDLVDVDGDVFRVNQKISTSIGPLVTRRLHPTRLNLILSNTEKKPKVSDA